MNAIASYTERRIGYRQTITLSCSSIHVEIWRQFGSSSTCDIPLKDLSSSSVRLLLEDSHIKSIYLFAMFVVFVIIAYYLHVGLIGRLIGAVLFVALIPVGVLLLPRLECVQFKFYSGVPAFVVARIGNERETFEAFVALIDKTIRERNSREAVGVTDGIDTVGHSRIMTE